MLVSRYLAERSLPVSYIVSIMRSSEIFRVAVRKLARLMAFMDRIAATAFRSIHGICTRPYIGSHVSPK